MNIKQRIHRNSRGTSTLEFIVVLPFLLFVTLVAVDLSRALFVYNSVVQAVREGARVGVVTPVTQLTPPDPNGRGVFNPVPATQRICNILFAAAVTNNNTCNDVTISVNCTNNNLCGPDSQVTAQVTLNIRAIFLSYLQWFGASLDWPFTEIAVMRYE